MPEVEDGGLVRRAIQLQSGEVPHGFDLAQSLLHCLIAEVVEQLHEVNPQTWRIADTGACRSGLWG
ncbi:MAG: hypothetical protein ACI88A_004580 [Paraglaciecola sp.]|jgi:hypothetical protein